MSYDDGNDNGNLEPQVKYFCALVFISDVRYFPQLRPTCYSSCVTVFLLSQLVTSLLLLPALSAENVLFFLLFLSQQNYVGHTITHYA